MRAALVTALAALSLGCGIDFEAQSEVIDLRTLAIQADPPEVLFEGALPPVSLRALVVDPRDPAREVQYRWRACGTTTDHRCDQATFVADLGGGSSALPELTSTLTLDPELLDAARQSDILRGFGGLVVYAELTVSQGEADEEVAFKEIVVQIALPDGTTPNRDPEAPGLLRDDADWPADEIPVVEPLQEVAIEPTAPEGDAESYSVFRYDLETQDLEEHLGYRFFSSAGTWNREQTGGPPDAISTETTLASRWTAPEEPTADPVHVWIVVRDGRGGLAWTERQIEVR